MLDIINNTIPFLEDCYREIGVREYSRIMKMSPPTASKALKELEKEGLLKKREDRGYLLFRANRESEILRDLSRIYWSYKLKKVIEYINSELHSPTIILFGSLSKLEAKKDSDIDLAILTKIRKKINLEKYEKEMRRKIELFVFESISNVNSKELKTNILNSYIMQGDIE